MMDAGIFGEIRLDVWYGYFSWQLPSGGLFLKFL